MMGEDYGGGKLWCRQNADYCLGSLCWKQTRPINLDKMYNIEDFVLIILVGPS